MVEPDCAPLRDLVAYHANVRRGDPTFARLSADTSSGRLQKLACETNPFSCRVPMYARASSGQRDALATLRYQRGGGRRLHRRPPNQKECAHEQALAALRGEHHSRAHADTCGSTTKTRARLSRPDAPTEDQREDQQDQKDPEQDPRDTSCGAGNAAKSQDRRDDRDHQESHYPSEHLKPPLRAQASCIPSFI